ncbi:MAG: hypothetical protein ACREBC_24830 [Pyrinomonadaceae bacterium]
MFEDTESILQRYRSAGSLEGMSIEEDGSALLADMLWHEYCRSRRCGTISQPGPMHIFGPLIKHRVDPALFDWTHRCVMCGRRNHAGIDCTHQIPA